MPVRGPRYRHIRANDYRSEGARSEACWRSTSSRRSGGRGVEIRDEIRLPAGIDVDLDLLARQRYKAETLRREVAVATRTAAAKLRAAGCRPGMSGSWSAVNLVLASDGSRSVMVEGGNPSPDVSLRYSETDSGAAACRTQSINLRRLGSSMVWGSNLIRATR